jgi:hypothetical protein
VAERIASAELRLWPGAGHLYTIGKPEADADIAPSVLRHS